MTLLIPPVNLNSCSHGCILHTNCRATVKVKHCSAPISSHCRWCTSRSGCVGIVRVGGRIMEERCGSYIQEKCVVQRDHLLVNTLLITNHKLMWCFLLGTPTGTILVYELCYKSKMPPQEWIGLYTFLSRANGDQWKSAPAYKHSALTNRTEFSSNTTSNTIPCHLPTQSFYLWILKS